MADEKILEQLRNIISGAFEVHQSVAKFKIHRTTVDGNDQTIYVEIFDRGETISQRYSCIAWPKNEPNNIITGNPEATIEDTIKYVHWNDLDKPLHVSIR